MSRSIPSRTRPRALPVPIVDRVARRTLLAAARRIRVGQLTIVLPDGSREVVGEPGGLHAEIHIHHEAGAVRMFLGGETGAGEGYMDGLWSSPDLAALLRLAARNREALALSRGWWRGLVAIPRVLPPRPPRPPHPPATRHIPRHNDQSNHI
jgi:cyclopropane-fatty-acyl-phospholipid synthase